ncbi:MAG: nucleotidyl transferase AbiEii/AbiGii toxin family protein [Bacteroidales bacterium]|nr:nucleotidyl transferase AbiEii/AbiGii toxin family protein [Bacteroidales bacterium]
MILKQSHTKDWIDSFRENPDYNKSDPTLIEKMINALTLLEELSKNKLNFVFKGGTSLILLSQNTNRFSIDIDILTMENRQLIEDLLSKICENSIFNKWELDKKRSYKEGLPKAHYKLYYNSVYNTNPKNENANYVLLDIVYTEFSYPTLIEAQIKTKWLLTEEPHTKVNIPELHSVLGDKLTAFAPNTTGILHNTNKQVEIIKQLFDVSFLIDEVKNIKSVLDSFSKTASKEIEYRQLDISDNDILDDIINTALMIARRERNTGDDKKKFAEISNGIRSIANFIMKGNFRIDEAIEASAKVAWFAIKLKNKDFSDLKIFDDKIEIASMQIEPAEYNYLNRLKKSNKAAFYYWYQCIVNMDS